MDVPCFGLTKDDATPQVISPTNAIQLNVSRNHENIDTFGKETYDLLEQVCLEIKYGKEDNVGEDEEEHCLKQAQRYTGLHRNVIYNLWKSPFTVNSISDIDRKHIYNELMKYNLQLKTMPTATDLFNDLQVSLPPYVDIRSFRNKLVKMGYVFKKTDSNIAVVIENPAVRFQRYMYLKNITRHREQNKQIYFICEGALTVDNVLNVDECERQELSEWHHRFICAVSSKEVKGFEHVSKDINYEKWILNTLVELDGGSVIILDSSKHLSEKFCETPTPNSLKCEMIDWLEYHQIPFDKTMSRLELWMLIDNYTDTNANLYKIDNLVKQSGSEVLRLPDCINNLSLTPFILKMIYKNVVYHVNDVKIIIDRLKDMIDMISDMELNLLSTSLVAEETRLLDLDIKLDKIIDELIPSTNPEIDTCLPSLSDVE